LTEITAIVTGRRTSPALARSLVEAEQRRAAY
jgi:hypothetical protein